MFFLVSIGAIAGIIERPPIVMVVMAKMNILPSEEELEKIRQSQEYPAFMPPPAIVASIKPEPSDTEAGHEATLTEVEGSLG